jgi:hypothetical protein
MKLDKKELNGYWFEANKETYYALIRAECSEFGGHTYELGLEWGYWRIEGKAIIACGVDAIKKHKQAYYHNGEFYDTDPAGSTNGEFFGSPVAAVLNAQKRKPFKEEPELTYEEQQNVAHGLDEKVPFPAMDEIEWVMVKAPEWYPVEFRYDNCGIKIPAMDISKEDFEFCKKLYENSKDFTVTWELKDKHADIKAEYAAAKEAEKNGGPIVKVFSKNKMSMANWNEANFVKIDGKEQLVWSDAFDYKLRYYNINWNKVPRFTQVEVRQSTNKDWVIREFLAAVNKWYICLSVTAGFGWQYCRLAPFTEIQDEWLEEIK